MGPPRSVDVVLLDGLRGILRATQPPEGGHHDVVAVHLEEAPQGHAVVAAAEAVGAQHRIRARHPGPDLLGEGAHVVRGGDRRALVQARAT
jgi:hypothetical protein